VAALLAKLHSEYQGRVIGFVCGDSVLKFEELSRFYGIKYAVSIASGTSVLMLSVIALGVRNRDLAAAP
jgi:dTDP-4-amino-4,6-dideoxygalactose transaminase